jgi:hypothetical protein
MRAAWLALLLAGCTPNGTYVLLTLDRAPGVPDGITSIDLSLTLAGQTADAQEQQAGFTFPTNLVLDVGSGAGELDIAATAATANGTTVATGSATATVTRGQRSAATLILMSSAVSMLTIDRTSYDFGTVTTGTTGGPINFLVTNNGTDPSGALSANVAGDAGSFDVSGCNGPALPPNATCMLSVNFKPSAAGSFHITVSVAAAPGGTVSADITGTAVAPTPLTIAPSPHDYSDVLDGVSTPFVFTVTNGGTTSTGALTTSLTGTDAAQFAVSNDNCAGQPLAPKATCTLTAAFMPSGATGARAASLTVRGSPGGIAAAQLSGRALTAAMISLSASSNDFGTVDVGMTTTPVDFVLTNNGGQTTGTLTTTLTGSTADFVVDMDACNGQSLLYLGTCTIRGHFAPASFGPKSLTVAISGSPGGSASMTWTGVGHDTVTLMVTTPFGGDGGGDVTATGINCPTGVCSIVLDRTGATAPSVTLTAAPHVDSDFGGWGGDCSGLSTMCTLSMTKNMSVSASFTRKHFTLSVTLNKVGSASGTVTSVTTPTEPSEISCGSTCSVERFYNDMVTLTATPAAGFYFGGWAGDCAGAGDTPTCNLTMTAAHSARATFTPANLIFTTSAKYTQAQVKAAHTGTITDPTAQMISGADALCATAGAKLIASGATWRAVIGTSTTFVNGGRIPSSARGWVRPDNTVAKPKPFGDNGIFGGGIYYPPNLTESGLVPLGASEASWTGSGRDGTKGSFTANCNDWTDTSSTSAVSAGYANAGAIEWLEGSVLETIFGATTFCSGSYHVLCMQTDYHAVVPAPIPPAGSRRIFVTDGAPKTSSGGAADWDTYCTTNGPGGNFSALVATNGATPASRFTARGVPIVRMDGVVIADTDSAFFGGTPPAAPINVTQSKAIYGPVLIIFSPVQPGLVFTGSAGVNVAGGSTNTCYSGSTSWTASSGVVTVGMASDPLWFDADSVISPIGYNTCADTSHIYCLED